MAKIHVMQKIGLIDSLLIILPALLCIIIYSADIEFRRTLTLIPSNYTILTIYTTNFVHYSFTHLAGNLATYVSLGIGSLLLYNKLGFGRIFRLSLLLILLVVPVASSLFSIFFFPHHLQTKPSYGFSAVASAVIGLFGFVIVLYLIRLNTKELLAYTSVLLFGISFILLIYGRILWGVILLLLFAVMFTYLMKSLRIDRKDAIFLFLALLLYQFAIISLFPSKIAQGGSIAHYVGFMLGYIIPWLLIGKVKNRRSFSLVK